MATIDISKIKSLEASTITMITSLKGLVEIAAAFELLCLIYPKNPDGTRFIHPTKTRNKIPYFGVSNSIVCVKYKGSVRGIRQNEGQMNNVVSVDLQCCNKNINLKLAKTKIQLTGASSEEMGNEAFEILCAHLNMIQSHIEYKNSLSEEVKNKTLDFFRKGNVFNLESLPEDVDIRLATFLSMYMEDFEDYNTFLEKIERIMLIETVCTENIQPYVSRISNSVYNYTLNREISLIQMTQHLYKKGFNVSFHNWSSTYLNVSIPILKEAPSEEEGLEGSEENYSKTPGSSSSGETIKTVSTKSDTSFSSEASEKSDALEKLDNDKIKAHRFIIYRGGSIKQTSPTSFGEALEARNMILESIEDFVF
jgi:hypothetical protein